MKRAYVVEYIQDDPKIYASSFDSYSSVCQKLQNALALKMIDHTFACGACQHQVHQMQHRPTLQHMASLLTKLVS